MNEFLAVEQVVALLTGAITFINEVVPFLTFGWRLAVLILFLILAMDLCLRSKSTSSALPSPYGRLALSIFVFGFIAAMLWTPMRKQYLTEHMPPSFVYIAPGVVIGGESSSALDTWMMLILHYGPKLVYHIGITFSDRDRGAALRLWGNQHPGQSPSPEQVEGSYKIINLDEVDPTGSGGSFLWQPVNLEDEHFSAFVSSRDGNYNESLNIKRINGKWLWMMTVSKADTGDILIDCQDRGFPLQTLSRQRPACFPAYSTSHQGDTKLPLSLPNENRVIAIGAMILCLICLLGFYSWFALWWMERWRRISCVPARK